MRKVILISLSIFITLITVIVAISKTIVPIIKNANYEKEIAKKNAQFAEQIQKEESNSNEEEFEFADVPETDGQRVGVYIGEYINLLNNKQYEEAYALLNEGFKEMNFPTLQSYTEYAKEKYSRKKVVQYNKFKIEGFVYVVDATIKDLSIYPEPKEFDQVFRFQETEPGVFNLSFGIWGGIKYESSN